jgi:threonine dehydratase
VFEEGGWAEIGRKRLSLDRIKGAGRVITIVFAGSPQYEVDPLNDEIGLRLVCKVETVNPIGSFKGCGTDYFLYRLRDERLGRLVCASAGNFGQGLAYAARKRGIPLTVFAAKTDNLVKVERMRRFARRFAWRARTSTRPRLRPRWKQLVSSCTKLEEYPGAPRCSA